MARDGSGRHGQRSLPIQIIHKHPRLLVGLIVGIAGFYLLPTRWPLASRVLIGWDGGVTLFLILICRWMSRLSAAQIRSHYSEEDASGPVILVLVTVAAALSLLAIVEPLSTLRHVEHGERIGRFLLAALTLIDSWLLVPTMFTMHYADLYYGAAAADRPLSFPQTDEPRFWDFAYFSLTIAAACQTSDVSTTQSSIRRMVIIHEIVSFAFNAAIIGFAINITAGLIAT